MEVSVLLFKQSRFGKKPVKEFFPQEQNCLRSIPLIVFRSKASKPVRELRGRVSDEMSDGEVAAQMVALMMVDGAPSVDDAAVVAVHPSASMPELLKGSGGSCNPLCCM